MREQPRLLSSGAISGCGSARFSCPSPGTPPGHGWEQIPPLGTAEQPDLQKVLKSKILPKKQNDAVREPKNPAAAPRAGGITVPCPRQVASPHCAPGRWHHHAMPQAGGITTPCPGQVASLRHAPGGWHHHAVPWAGGITAPCPGRVASPHHTPGGWHHRTVPAAHPGSAGSKNGLLVQKSAQKHSAKAFPPPGQGDAPGESGFSRLKPFCQL